MTRSSMLYAVVMVWLCLSLAASSLRASKPEASRFVDLISRNALASVDSPPTGANAHRLITIFVNHIKSTSRYAHGLVEYGFSSGQSDAPVRAKIGDQDRTTINRSNHSVWFDSDDGTVRPIHRSKSIDVTDRHSSIAGPVQTSSTNWWDSLRLSLGDFFSWIFRGWQILLIVSLISLLLVVGFIVMKYGVRFQERVKKMTAMSVQEREKSKIRDLPFQVEQTMFGLLAQAERYRAAGDFSKAIIYLFSHALVEMDSARCIRLERGKTNRVYLRELRERDNLRNFTYQLVLAFEYAFFGKHALSLDAFDSIWQQLPAFDAYIKHIESMPSSSQSANAARDS